MHNIRHNTYFLIWAVLPACLGVFLMCGCDSSMRNKLKNSTPNKAAAIIEENQDYYAKHLRIGMNKEEVLNYFPKPTNTNTENVCVWVYNSASTTKSQGRLDWEWLQMTRGGFFIVFVDNKLATPLCANAAFNPYQALQYYGGLSSERVREILGKSTDRKQGSPQ